jgi:hypothetical protein
MMPEINREITAIKTVAASCAMVTLYTGGVFKLDILA